MRTQHRQHTHPGSALPTIRQTLLPEPIQLQLPPQLHKQPARSPLARVSDEKISQPHLHPALRRVLRDGAVGREQRQAHLLLAAGIEDLDAFEPALLLAVIDLAQVKDMALHDALIAAPATFHNGPVAMLLAIFETV